MFNDIKSHFARSINISVFDPKLDTVMGWDWSKMARSGYLFQIGVDGNIKIIDHFVRSHKTKYERIMPSWTGEVATAGECAEKFMPELMSFEGEQLFGLTDHEPFVTSDENDFESVFNGKQVKYPREIIHSIETLALLPTKMRMLHCEGSKNYPPDFWTRCGQVKQIWHYLDIQELNDLKPGAEIYSMSTQMNPMDVVMMSIGNVDIDAKKTTIESLSMEQDCNDLTLATVIELKTDEDFQKFAERKKRMELKRNLRDALLNASDKRNKDPFKELLIAWEKHGRDKEAFDIDKVKEQFSESEAKAFVNVMSGKMELSFKNDVIFLNGKEYIELKDQYEAINEAHSFGHFGKGMTERNMQMMYFLDMPRKVEAFISLCPECDRENAPLIQANLGVLPVKSPYETIVADLKQMSSNSDVKYLMGIKEKETGYFQILRQGSKETSEIIASIEQWRQWMGPFSQLIFDNEKGVLSKEFDEYAKKNGFIVRNSSPANKSQGSVEIMWRYVNDILRKEGGDQRNIEALIPKMVKAINSRPRFEFAGIHIDNYGIMRGSRVASVAERRNLQKIDEDMDFNDWLINKYIMTKQITEEEAKKRRVPFYPEDLSENKIPQVLGVGSVVYVDSETVGASLMDGNQFTKSTSYGPLIIKGMG